MTHDRRPLLLLLLLLLLPASVSAQTVPQVPTNTPYQGIFTHDGTGVTGLVGSGYRCYADAIKVGADLPPSARQANGDITCSFPALTVLGPHTFQASAFNAGGETKSVALTFTVFQPPPPIPTNLRILVAGQLVRSDGTTAPILLSLEIPLP